MTLQIVIVLVFQKSRDTFYPKFLKNFKLTLLRHHWQQILTEPEAKPQKMTSGIFYLSGEVFNRKQVEVKPSGFDTYTLNRAYFKWWLHDWDSTKPSCVPIQRERERERERERNDQAGWDWRKETSFAILLEVFPQNHPEGTFVTCVFEHSVTWSWNIFFFKVFVYLFIYGCVGSSFLCEGFL